MAPISKAYNFIDLAGQKFGRLTAVRYGYFSRRSQSWECVCDCGAVTEASSNALRTGRHRSCGCEAHEKTAARSTKHGWASNSARRDGKPPGEYSVWATMLARCRNPAAVGYEKYGALGVSVCERWYSFACFIEDMGPRPTSRHTIDRIDNDGNYEPENCRWATYTQQARNKSNNVLATIDGLTLTMKAWSEKLPFAYQTAIAYVGQGMTPEESVRLAMERFGKRGRRRAA